jgi:hypothetical protein
MLNPRTAHDALNAAGACGRPDCGNSPSHRYHKHCVAWECDGSHEEDAECHRFVCRLHGRGGDLDYPPFVPFSFCGRCTLDALLFGKRAK